MYVYIYIYIYYTHLAYAKFEDFVCCGPIITTYFTLLS